MYLSFFYKTIFLGFGFACLAYPAISKSQETLNVGIMASQLVDEYVKTYNDKSVKMEVLVAKFVNELHEIYLLEQSFKDKRNSRFFYSALTEFGALKLLLEAPIIAQVDRKVENVDCKTVGIESDLCAMVSGISFSGRFAEVTIGFKEKEGTYLINHMLYDADALTFEW